MGLTGDWGKANLVTSKLSNMNDGIYKYMMREAEALRGEIVKGFTSQGAGDTKWKKLSPLTLAKRRLDGFTGTKALIYTGEMRKSIVVKGSRFSMTAFVGLLYNAKSKDGKSLVNIGRIHEFGTGYFIIPITPKMRKFLGVLLSSMGKRKSDSKKGGKSHIVTKIPARPFLRPAKEVWEQKVEERAFYYFKSKIG